VVNETIDDLSSAVDSEPAVPGFVMVATGRRTTALASPVPADLGRQVTAGGHVHEIDDERMSRDHATVRFERGLWVIADRDSRNGTFVDGERITGEVRRRGDIVLRLGHTVFVLLTDWRGHPAATDGAHVVGPELQRTYAQIQRHATADTLLIHGESGSGKELAARLYHDAGPRRGGPFVAINCAAIPEGVAERLLFGAKKGAFSGAIDALGHFQMANGGTLFLDEIADLDAAVQAKLLRVLETREVVPVGASAGITLDLGIVAASHRELRAAVADNRFREDLFYRLARSTVHLPPLRERKVDIARLVQREIAAVDRKLAPHAKLVEACCLRAWPGNVRELCAAVRQAADAARAGGRDVVRVDDLAVTAGQPVGGIQGETSVDRPKAAPAELDKEGVVAALARANGVISVAARALGLHRTQLYRLMEKYGLARDDT
jgi:transcriptional regulator with PAS, ATPase and Fis domain